MTIYFPFGYKPVSGGDYVNLDHIRTLNRLGIEAKVLFCGEDRSYIQDFEEDIPLIDYDFARLNDNDIIITSECHRPIYKKYHTGSPRVIMHNQNPFLTYYGFTSSRQINEQVLSGLLYRVNMLRKNCEK